MIAQCFAKLTPALLALLELLVTRQAEIGHAPEDTPAHAELQGLNVDDSSAGALALRVEEAAHWLDWIGEVHVGNLEACFHSLFNTHLASEVMRPYAVKLLGRIAAKGRFSAEASATIFQRLGAGVAPACSSRRSSFSTILINKRLRSTRNSS